MSVIDDAAAALLDERNRDIVDMVLYRSGRAVKAATMRGSVTFTKDGPVQVEGQNPLARQDPAALSPLDAERAALRPENQANHYPYAYDNIAHLFEDPRAPDIAVVHTPAHNWEDRGGHRGEHGSPGLIQSRAPLIVSGAGVKALGSIAESARMVEVAPMLLALAGERSGGRVIDDRERPEHVVAFLCDGTNANVLYAMARSGECPNTARLMESGTVFEHGLIASFPTVTLANHTTALTGVHPGQHGVLHNAYFDRETGRQILTNSPSTWHLARHEIRPSVKTLFERIDGFTAAVNEPCDRGATYATFDAVRDGGDVAGRLQAALPDPREVPHATQAFVQARAEYAWSTAADHMAVQQAVDLWAGTTGNPRPTLMWINLILNDAGNHAGGPYSEIGYAALRDTDERLGVILDAMDWGSGTTAFMVLADHGMEESDPSCTGDYTVPLAEAGIAFRDEGFGFLYL